MDGTNQLLYRDDILERLQRSQNILNTTVYTLDNFDQRIKSVNIVAAAAQTAYIQRWASVNSPLTTVVNF